MAGCSSPDPLVPRASQGRHYCVTLDELLNFSEHEFPLSKWGLSLLFIERGVVIMHVNVKPLIFLLRTSLSY